MNQQTITLGYGHGIKAGDHISIPMPPAPWWVRIWLWLKGCPTTIECDVVRADATSITVSRALCRGST